MSLENSAEIRVVMLVASLPPMPAGGAEAQALKLGETLKKKGVAVSFITPGNSRNKGAETLGNMPVFRLHSWLNGIFEKFSAAKKNKQSPIVQIEYDDKKEITNQITRKVGWPTVIYYNIFFFHSLFFLWRRRSTFDIIHAHTMEWSAIVATRLGRALGKKVIIKDSTMNGFQSLSRFPSGHRLQKLITSHAHFIAMTKMINENLLKQGIPAGQITRIPNGIVLKEIERNHARSNKPAKILFVGNLYQQPAKGVDILLHAFQIVHKQFPEVILQIVGDGVNDAYDSFVKQLSIDKSVEFCGKQSDLATFYDQADIFVLPSRREGMSNALMEAMLYGMPSIATDISGSQDLIINGQNGILVKPADLTALAEAVIFMLTHPEIASNMGANARETVIKNFDMNIIAEEYISLYKLLSQEKK